MKKNKYIIFLYAFLIQIFYLFLIHHGSDDILYVALLFNIYIGQGYLVLRITLILLIIFVIPVYFVYVWLKRKKYIYILLYFSLSILFIIIKNFCVYYFIYDDFRLNRFAFTKNIENSWTTKYITNDELGNELLEKKFIQFESDTSGIYVECKIYDKIDGTFSKFNWKYPNFNSLLPYSDNPLNRSEYRFLMDNEYFIILSSTYRSNEWPAFHYSDYQNDTYFKYKFSGDTLFFDSHPATYKYWRQPKFEHKTIPFFKEMESGFPWHLFVFWK